MAPTLGGSFGTLGAFIGPPMDGDRFTDFTTNDFMDSQVTFSSLPFAFPKAGSFKDQVLIRTPNKNYTAYDYRGILRLLCYDYVLQEYLKIKDLNGLSDQELELPSTLKGTNVSIFCRFGSRFMPTPVSAVVFKELEPNLGMNDFQILFGGGDGSLEPNAYLPCLNYRFGVRSFYTRHFGEKEHKYFPANKRVIDYLLNVVDSFNGNND